MKLEEIAIGRPKKKLKKIEGSRAGERFRCVLGNAATLSFPPITHTACARGGGGAIQNRGTTARRGYRRERGSTDRTMRNDESRYNPLCRRRRATRQRDGEGGGSEGGGPDEGGGGGKNKRNILHHSGRSESESDDNDRGEGGGSDDDDSGGSSSGSDLDLDAEVHRARVARLRHQRESRGDILRQLETLETIRRERETRRALDDEMETVRRRLGEEGERGEKGGKHGEVRARGGGDRGCSTFGVLRIFGWTFYPSHSPKKFPNNRLLVKCVV